MITFQQNIVMDTLFTAALTLFVIVIHFIFASDVSHEGSYVITFIKIEPNKF